MTINFKAALELTDADCSLLIGNGFSMAQAGQQFSYTNLLEKAGLSEDDALKKVFQTLKTVDFELVMQALQYAASIEAAYDDEAKESLFNNDASRVREALIHAVREVHPGISFDIPEAERTCCGNFLRQFKNIFTVNYDLLLYWVILKMGGNIFTDGFGLGETSGGFRTFSKEAICNTYYLHGALHLFLGERRDTLKRTVTSGTIINDIAATIRQRGQLPLFVSEGTATQKMARINSVPYLRHGYEKLRDLRGSLFVLGHSLAENDYHLYNAIFASNITKLFFCVYKPNENLQRIKERLAPFSARNDEIEIHYIDTASLAIWR